MHLSGLGFVSVIIGKNGEVVDIRRVKAHPLIASTAADATVSSAASSESMVAGLIAFRTPGRSTVSTATPSASETSTSSMIILQSDIGILLLRK